MGPVWLGRDVRGHDAGVDRRGGLRGDREAFPDLGHLVCIDHSAGAVPDVELGDGAVADPVRDGSVQLWPPRHVAGEHLAEQRRHHEVRGALCDPLGVAQRLVLSDLPADEHGPDGDHCEDQCRGAEVGDE